MELGEAGAEQKILDGGEDAVTDELVEWHPAVESASGRHHPAPEHGVCSAVAKRLEKARKLLGRILAIAVNHGHDIESVRDGGGVPHLLVTAVALVVPVAQKDEGKLGVGLLVRSSDLVGPIRGRIVHDQDLGFPLLEDGARDAFEDGAKCRLRLVGDDEDEEAVSLGRGFVCRAGHHSVRW